MGHVRFVVDNAKVERCPLASVCVLVRLQSRQLSSAKRTYFQQAVPTLSPSLQHGLARREQERDTCHQIVSLLFLDHLFLPQMSVEHLGVPSGVLATGCAAANRMNQLCLSGLTHHLRAPECQEADVGGG